MTKTEASCIRNYPDVDQINNCIRTIDNVSVSISTLSKIMNLAGNETRLKMLYIIYKEKQVCVCDLSDILNSSVSAVSQHLRKLKDGNLITDKKEGKTIYYSIKEESLEVLLSIFIQISKNKNEEVLS
jgi:ArsR family transcriptional regulator, lead/cadmium/zinc/bismuth-responsive transcriptional repressor